jgi:hypothetical protein
MTEAEWLACDDPVKMVSFLRDTGKLDLRRIRLSGAAQCRRVWHLMTDPRSRTAVEVAERWADGEATREELDEAFMAAFDVFAPYQGQEEVAPGWAACAAYEVSHPDEAAEALVRAVAHAGGEGEATAQAQIMRCVFGDQFRPAALDPARLTPTIVSLAQAAYHERILPGGELDLARLSILADALEDEGGADGILSHLRAPGPHVRGCWALDLVLGKE